MDFGNDWLEVYTTKLDNKIRIMKVVSIEPLWCVVESLAYVLVTKV